MLTPFVQIDVPTVDRNIAVMAASASARGLALRPHAKTHKIPEIARRQLAAGAVGLTVATIGEAEVFADAGCTDLFIAYPLWPSPEAVERVAALARRVRLAVGTDSAEAAAGWAGTGARVLVEVDSGHHRSGVTPQEAAAFPADGAFTFPGHSYAPGASAAAAADEEAALLHARAGRPDFLLSGGSTPSARASVGGAGGIDEIRPGVYVFGDAQQLTLGTCSLDDVALTVRATVVSQGPGRVVVDAGSKILGSDKPAFMDSFARTVDGHRLVSLSEHHGTIAWDTAVDGPQPPRGTQLDIIPNHACLVPNLVDEVVARDGDAVEKWQVAARGRV